MNGAFRQAERLGRLTTEFGPDVLSLLRFEGTDYLNDLFEYRVEALATRDDLDFDAIIGTHATVEIEAHSRMRPFDGIVTSARWAGAGENGHRYDLVLRPWFWLAGRRRNQRIFHNRNVIQILRELFSDYAGLGEPALDTMVSKHYPVLEYTVQYRESDLDFARRQMERHGISFHFRHALGSHAMVLTDDVLAHEEIGPRPFKRYDGHHHYEQEHFWDWAPERNITTGAVRLTDYNFKKPNQVMEVDRLGDAAHAQGQIESFDYPGDYLAHDVGKVVVGLRTEQERGADRRNRAVGDCVSLGAGMRMTLTGDRVPGHGETFLCLSASHQFVSEAYGSGGQQSDGYAFSGSYVLMPDTAPLAPPRRTPAAIVQGPQTAVVVGEGEIDCDEYGRILVRFHWDLAGAYSMRCRVSQNWAGGGWGGMVIPRIGMEVLVEFLEGDPDKPVVVGNVFNGENAVPYDLPRHKTRSTFRTNTHDGKQTGRGYNELRFEDEQGLEEVYLRAEKDLSVRVRENRVEHIGGTNISLVRHDSREAVNGDYSHRVLGDAIISVGASRADEDVHHYLNLGEDNLRDPLLSKPKPLFGNAKSGGLLSIISTGMMTLVSRASVMIRASQSIRSHARKDVQLEAGADIDLSGGRDIDITSRKSTSIRSGRDIYINTDNIRLVMTQDGDLHIRGKSLHIDASADIKLTSGGDMDLKAGGNVNVNGTKINLN